MSQAKQIIVRWASLGAVVAAAWVGYRSLYASPRDALLADIEASKANIAGIEQQLKGEFEVVDRIRAASGTTLGVKLDEVSARFRDGLSRIAESNSMTGVIVDHGEPQDIKSPLLAAKSVPSSLRSALRGGGDFSILRGTLRASGTIEQALSTLAAVEAQPWIHRVEGFTLRPSASKDGPRCEIRIEAATLLTPRFKGGKTAELAIASVDDATKGMVRDIAARQMLAKGLQKRADASPAVTVAAAAPAGEAPPPQPFAPYEEWRLTGIMVGRFGPEAFSVNSKSGERRTVQKGGTVLDAVFVDAAGEVAYVEIGGKRFEVLNGQALSARKPVGETR